MPTAAPAISIIIPCYTYGSFLPETLQSLMAQSFSDWECILVANGSDEYTMNVIHSFMKQDTRFSVIETENRGPSAARNTGLNLAKGEYIQFLDADDKLDSSRFEIMIGEFEKNDSYDLLYSKVRYFTNENPNVRLERINDLIATSKENFSGTNQDYYNILINRNIFTINAPLFKREIINIRFDETIQYLEDWDFWIRLSPEIRNFKFLADNETFALVRYHNNSHSRDNKAMLSANLPILIHNIDFSLLKFKSIFIIIYRISIQIWTLMTDYGIESLVQLKVRFYQKLLLFVFIPFSIPFFLIYLLKSRFSS